MKKVLSFLKNYTKWILVMALIGFVIHMQINISIAINDLEKKTSEVSNQLSIISRSQKNMSSSIDNVEWSISDIESDISYIESSVSNIEYNLW